MTNLVLLPGDTLDMALERAANELEQAAMKLRQDAEAVKSGKAGAVLGAYQLGELKMPEDKPSDIQATPLAVVED